MIMRRVNLPTLGAAVLLAAGFCPPGHAAEQQYRYEISPFLAYRVGGTFEEQDDSGEFDVDESTGIGIIINGPAGRDWPDGQWEFIYARQDTAADTIGLLPNDPRIDIDIEYYHLGGTYLFQGENVRPFVAMGLGMSRFDPRPGQFDAESFFSASLGGGVHLNAKKRFGLRLEARVYTTFVDNDSDLFCSSDFGAASCLILADSSTLTQWEARAGLVYRF